MNIFSSPAAVQAWRRSLQREVTVGFVPTMGALHAGHLSLVRRSVRECDVTVASIFVNPAQFGPKEDFTRYPRPIAADRRLLASAGVDVLFSPRPDQMYPDGFATTVTVAGLTSTLCGAPTSRGPGHFAGVATVVAKLFSVAGPTRAYFGMKDFQQVRVIEQMTADMNLEIQVIRCPTVREKDGLAMSSRNAYLSAADRAYAPRLYLSLQQGAKLLASRHSMRPSAVLGLVKEALSHGSRMQIEYISLVDPRTLQPLAVARRPALLAAAVRLGNTRLIDNILVR